MSRARFIIVLFLLLTDNTNLYAQAAPNSELPNDNKTNDWNHELLVASVSLGTISALLAGGAVAWWTDHETRPFHLQHSGLFEESSLTGGSDKLGHIFSCYATTIGFANIYEEMGLTKKNRIFLAASMTTLIGTGVEVIDGFTQHGFDYMDAIANFVGIALASLELIYPQLDDAIGIRWGYIPSPRFIEKTKFNFINAINDYSGMIYYADVNVGGFGRLINFQLPRYTDFILVGLNYGSWEYDPTGPVEDKRRRLGFHVALSLHKVFESLLEPSFWRTGISGLFDFYAPPFTSIQVTHDQNTGCNQIGFGLNGRAVVPPC